MGIAKPEDIIKVSMKGESVGKAKPRDGSKFRTKGNPWAKQSRGKPKFHTKEFSIDEVKPGDTKYIIYRRRIGSMAQKIKNGIHRNK